MSTIRCPVKRGSIPAKTTPSDHELSTVEKCPLWEVLLYKWIWSCSIEHFLLSYLEWYKISTIQTSMPKHFVCPNCQGYCDRTHNPTTPCNSCFLGPPPVQYEQIIHMAKTRGNDQMVWECPRCRKDHRFRKNFPHVVPMAYHCGVCSYFCCMDCNFLQSSEGVATTGTWRWVGCGEYSYHGMLMFRFYC